MRDAPLSLGDVFGMAGLVAFAASAVVLWSVSPADAAPMVEDPPFDHARLLWTLGVFVTVCAVLIGLLEMRDRRAARARRDDELDYRDAESRGGRADG